MLIIVSTRIYYGVDIRFFRNKKAMLKKQEIGELVKMKASRSFLLDAELNIINKNIQI